MKELFYRLKYVFIIFNFFALSNCTFFGPVKTKPQIAYELSGLPAVPIKKRTSKILMVPQPDSLPMYNTTQMFYTPKPYQIASFSQNRWADTPAQMLHPLLIQSLQKMNYFHAVVSPPYTGKYDYLLNLQVLELKQDFIYRPATLKFSLKVDLIKSVGNRILVTKIIKITEPMRFCNPYNGVLAANRVTKQLLSQINALVVRYAR